MGHKELRLMLLASAAACLSCPGAAFGQKIVTGEQAPTAAQTEREAEQRTGDVGLPDTASKENAASDDGEDDIRVTGSRLSDGDVTSQKIVIDRAEIQRRGVTSVEELIRTLPQNVATIGAITNDRAKGPLQRRAQGAGLSQLGTLGVSAANLGGTGAGNTLVLVNGRRLAGAAGIEDGFVNLNGIPLSAVERVEIIPSGAASVYGADALSGVINFILIKGYRGLTLGSQTLLSSTGGDNARFNAFGGFSWGSGSLNATAEYARRHPVINRKTGFVTENYSAYYNGDPAYDGRSFTRGLQPGVIDVSSGDFDPETFEYIYTVRGLTVRPGLNRPPTAEDFIEIGQDAARDYVPRLAGPLVDSLSLTYNFDQRITERLRVFSTGLFTRAKNRQQVDVGSGLGFELAPGQAYNPFPQGFFNPFSVGTTVYYYPAAEIADGSLVPGTIRNTTKQWSINAGASYDFGGNNRLTLNYTTSRSSASGSGTRIGSVVTLAEDPTAPSGFRCANFFLDSDRVTGRARETLQAAFDRQCRALTSSDPAVAFNPFRSTTGAPGGGIQDFLYEDQTEERSSRLQLFEGRLTGTVMTLPAGKLTYALGGEYADDGVDSREVRNVTGSVGSRDRYAFFGEVSLPILSPDYDLPLMRSLTFNLAGRRDTYVTEGAIGTVDDVPVELGGELVFGKNRFSRFTPSFGLRYQPVDDVTFLAKWGRGFQPPPFTRLFSPIGTQSFQRLIIDDPFYTCSADCQEPGDPSSGYLVRQVFAPNPDLRPQTSRQESFSASWAPTKFLSGLQIDATYNRTVIRNEFADNNDLFTLLTPAEAYSIPLFYPRNASGKITQIQNSIFNLVGSEYKSITLQASYFMMTKFGNFEPKIIYVDNLKALRRGLPNSTPISSLGTLQGPDNYKITGSLTFYRDQWSVTLWGYHTPSYVNDYAVDYRNGRVLNETYAKPVESYTTFDLTGTWTTKQRIRLNAAVRNIFNPRPPFVVAGGLPYDTARWDVAGRTVMLQAELSF